MQFKSIRRLAIPILAAVLVTVSGCGSTRRLPPGVRTGPPATRSVVAGSAPPPERLVGVPGPGQSDVEVTLDPDAMRTLGVDSAAVSVAVQKFFESYPFYSLKDLQEIKVRSAGGENIPLRKIASIDVWFGAARTVVVEKAASGSRGSDALPATPDLPR